LASLRVTARIARSVDEVWKVVSGPGIWAWFPGIEKATGGDGTHSCTLPGGHQLEADVVTIDEQLRRFPYRITGGISVEHHLGTVDVLEDGPGRRARRAKHGDHPGQPRGHDRPIDRQRRAGPHGLPRSQQLIGAVTRPAGRRRARSARPMTVHVWSGTVVADDNGPLGVALSPGVDAKARARLEARLVRTAAWAR